MNDILVENLIKKIGLTKNEENVYKALIKFGSKSTLELSKQLKLGRTVVYNSITKLVENMLVVEIIEKNDKVFEINTPECLNLLVEEKKRRLRKFEQEITRINRFFIKVFRYQY